MQPLTTTIPPVVLGLAEVLSMATVMLCLCAAWMSHDRSQHPNSTVLLRFAGATTVWTLLTLGLLLAATFTD